MNDLTPQEAMEIINGYENQVRHALSKKHGPAGAQAVFDAVGRGGGLTPEERFQAAQSIPPEQMAEALTEATFPGQLRENFSDWSTPGRAQLSDEAWHEMRNKQKRESVGRPWSTKR